MAITSRGKGWELRHSIWIAWALFALPWISFFYIGIRTKHRRWLVWGAVYSVPFILTMVTGESPDSSGSALSGFLLVVAWIGGIIHAFRVRKEYLLRLEAAQRSRTDTDATLRQRIQTEYGSGTRGPASGPVAGQTSNAAPNPNLERRGAPPNPTPSPPSPSAVPQRSSVDLNKASERDIASLPGVGVIVAKRAVGLRESRGGFHSLEDFGQALNLKPHVVERLRPLVSVSPPQQFGRSDSSGRVVDF